MSLGPYEPNEFLPSPADIEILHLREEIKKLRSTIRNLEFQLEFLTKKPEEE